MGDAARVTSEKLTKVLSDSAASMIIAYDEAASLCKKTLKTLALTVTSFTPWTPVDNALLMPAGRTAKSKWHTKDGQGTLIVTETALVKTDGAGTRQILFEDIVIAGDRACGCLTLVDHRGQSIEFETDDWKRLKSLKRRIIEILNPALIRTFPKH